MTHGPTSVPGDEDGTRHVAIFDMDDNESADEEDEAEEAGETSAERLSVRAAKYKMDID